MTEFWKPIEYPSVPKDVKHYEVSSLGRVRRGSIMEKMTQEQNGDVTVILLSLNGDYVGPDSTPPRKYVVQKLFDDAFNPEPRVFGVGGDDQVFDPPWRSRTYDRCRHRFSRHPLESFQGLNGEKLTHEVLS